MRTRSFEFGIALTLILITLLAYGPLLTDRFEFVNFDDYEYVVENPIVHAGCTLTSFGEALRSHRGQNWLPLTWVSLQLDYELHGLEPRGYHTTNLLFHVANTVLLFFLLARSTGSTWRSATAAMLFGIHPLHVESVAWVTERKDVLSGFFWLLTMLAYVRYARKPGAGRYLVVAVGLVLGLMCKPMVVTLPCVLLLFDYWPLRRWQAVPADPQFPQYSLAALLREKILLLLLVAACSVLEYRAAQSLIEESRQELTLGMRSRNVPMAYLAYIRELFVPDDLAALYLYPPGGTPTGESLVGGLVLLALSAGVVVLRRSRPHLPVSWFWFLGMLVPTIGLVQVALQSHADRFTYLPMIGITIALIWSVPVPGRTGRIALGVAAAAVVALCVIATRAQLEYWRTSVDLWNRAAAVSGDDPRVHRIASGMFLSSGELEHAERHATKQRERAPDDPESYRTLAGVLVARGRIEEALGVMEEEAARRADPTEVRNARARLLWSRGRITQAYREYTAVAAARPDSPPGQNFLGIQAQQEGRLDDALGHLAAAARMDPQNARYHSDLALALEDRGDRLGAAGAYRTAMAIDPNWPEVCATIAWLLAAHPQVERRDGVQAVRWARMACAMSEYAFPPHLERLAAAYAEAGRFDRAIETATNARDLARNANDQETIERLDAALRSYRTRQPVRDPTLTGR